MSGGWGLHFYFNYLFFKKISHDMQHVESGILIPQPGIEPMALHWKGRALNHCQGKSLLYFISFLKFHFVLNWRIITIL